MRVNDFLMAGAGAVFQSDMKLERMLSLRGDCNDPTIER
jgi:hypothetical protein